MSTNIRKDVGVIWLLFRVYLLGESVTGVILSGLIMPKGEAIFRRVGEGVNSNLEVKWGFLSVPRKISISFVCADPW